MDGGTGCCGRRYCNEELDGVEMGERQSRGRRWFVWCLCFGRKEDVGRRLLSRQVPLKAPSQQELKGGAGNKRDLP